MEHSDTHRYAVILAGGAGYRLWPLSRAESPKQFLKLFNGKSSFRLQFELLLNTVPAHRIFVGVPPSFVKYVVDAAPELPQQNIILKRTTCDTGVSAYLVASTIAKLDPDAEVVMVWADHIIDSHDSFTHTLEQAFAAVGTYPDTSILVGTEPRRPHTGLGYIRYGSKVKGTKIAHLHEVVAFEEKPDKDRAAQYLRSGNRLWNTGYHAFHAQRLVTRMRTVVPYLASVCDDVALTEHPVELSPRSPEALAKYKELEKLTFEQLFSQELPFFVLKAPFEWYDIGDWKTVRTVLSKMRAGVEDPKHVLIDSPNSIVVGNKRLVALFGVKDVIVVETDDAILVVDRNKGRNTKELIQFLQKGGYEQYF